MFVRSVNVLCRDLHKQNVLLFDIIYSSGLFLSFLTRTSKERDIVMPNEGPL